MLLPIVFPGNTINLPIQGRENSLCLDQDINPLHIRFMSLLLSDSLSLSLSPVLPHSFFLHFFSSLQLWHMTACLYEQAGNDHRQT